MSPWHREWFRIEGETGEEQRAGVLQGSQVRDEQAGANVRGTASRPHQPALSETRSVGLPRACPAHPHTDSHSVTPEVPRVLQFRQIDAETAQRVLESRKPLTRLWVASE